MSMKPQVSTVTLSCPLGSNPVLPKATEILVLHVDGFFPPGLGDLCYSELSWCHERLWEASQKWPPSETIWNQRGICQYPALFIFFFLSNLSSLGETEKIAKIWKLLHKTGSVWAQQSLHVVFMNMPRKISSGMGPCLSCSAVRMASSPLPRSCAPSSLGSSWGPLPDKLAMAKHFPKGSRPRQCFCYMGFPFLLLFWTSSPKQVYEVCCLQGKQGGFGTKISSGS